MLGRQTELLWVAINCPVSASDRGAPHEADSAWLLMNMQALRFVGTGTSACSARARHPRPYRSMHRCFFQAAQAAAHLAVSQRLLDQRQHLCKVVASHLRRGPGL